MTIIDRVLGKDETSHKTRTDEIGLTAAEGTVSITTAEESARIAKLTADALRTSGDKMVEDVRKAIEAAEHTTAILRLEADNLCEEIKRHVGNFADRTSGFVDNCHGAVKMFRDVQSKLGSMHNGVVNWDVSEHR